MKKNRANKVPFYSYVVWIIGALFFFYKYIIEVSPSVMVQNLMSSFHIGAAQLGNLAAVYFYAYLIMQIPVGLLVDRFGPRRVVTIAIFICAAGIFIFGTAQSLWIAEVGRFIVGFGAAFAAINSLKLAANWFPHKYFAFLAGLLLSIGMIGAVFGQAPLSYFIAKISWRDAMKFISTFGAILAVVFWIIVRDGPKNVVKEKGFGKKKFWEGCKLILKNPQSWFLSIYSGFLFAPVMAFGELWGVTFIQEAFTFSKQGAAQAVSMIFIGLAIGAPLFGWISDKIRKRKLVMFIGFFASFVFMLAILYLPFKHHFIAYPLLFFMGFFISSFLLSFTIIREINYPLVTATAIGFMNTFNAVMGSITDPLVGKILDLQWDGTMHQGARIFSTGNYRYALSILPIYLIIGFIMLLFIKETNCKDKYPNALSD